MFTLQIFAHREMSDFSTWKEGEWVTINFRQYVVLQDTKYWPFLCVQISDRKHLQRFSARVERNTFREGERKPAPFQDGKCKDFPLKTQQHPRLLNKGQCGTINDYFKHDNFSSSQSLVSECFKEKTVIVLGDSRAAQLFRELSTLFAKKDYNLK